MAICSGEILQRRWVSGYGGLVVQACDLKGERVTVVYGHLKLASASLKVGEKIMAGQTFQSQLDAWKDYLKE